MVRSQNGECWAEKCISKPGTEGGPPGGLLNGTVHTSNDERASHEDMRSSCDRSFTVFHLIAEDHAFLPWRTIHDEGIVRREARKRRPYDVKGGDAHITAEVRKAVVHGFLTRPVYTDVDRTATPYPRYRLGRWSSHWFVVPHKQATKKERAHNHGFPRLPITEIEGLQFVQECGHDRIRIRSATEELLQEDRNPESLIVLVIGGEKIGARDAGGDRVYSEYVAYDELHESFVHNQTVRSNHAVDAGADDNIPVPHGVRKSRQVAKRQDSLAMSGAGGGRHRRHKSIDMGDGLEARHWLQPDSSVAWPCQKAAHLQRGGAHVRREDEVPPGSGEEVSTQKSAQHATCLPINTIDLVQLVDQQDAWVGCEPGDNIAFAHSNPERTFLMEGSDRLPSFRAKRCVRDASQ